MIKTDRILGFCNLHAAPLIGGLNDNRSLGSVTFLGRYALMDFALSNFSNSGIDQVGILVRNFPHSVISHVRSGTPWIRNTKTGFQFTVYNEAGHSKPLFNTSLSNIYENRALFDDTQADYVVIAPVNYVMAMDFRPIIEAHIKSGCPVTMAYAPIHDGKSNFLQSETITLRKDGTVMTYQKNSHRKDEILVSLDTYVISADALGDLIRATRTENRSYDVKEAIRLLSEKSGMKVNSFCFEHFVLTINTFEEYISSSFKMLKYESRRKMFRPEWPIYTTTHDTPPAKYGPNAKVSNSIVSNGCIINGSVENSILSRNVVIGKGAKVKDCILFTDTVIGEKSNVNGVVTDKHVAISASQDITGSKDKPTLLKSGTRI